MEKLRNKNNKGFNFLEVKWRIKSFKHLNLLESVIGGFIFPTK